MFFYHRAQMHTNSLSDAQFYLLEREDSDRYLAGLSARPPDRVELISTRAALSANLRDRPPSFG